MARIGPAPDGVHQTHIVDEHQALHRFHRGEPVIVQRHRTPGGRLVVRVRPYPSPPAGPTRRLRPAATRRPVDARRVRVRWVVVAAVVLLGAGCGLYAAARWAVAHAWQVGALAAVVILAVTSVHRPSRGRTR